jgi:hypothetical protein
MGDRTMTQQMMNRLYSLSEKAGYTFETYNAIIRMDYNVQNIAELTDEQFKECIGKLKIDVRLLGRTEAWVTDYL